MSEVSHVSRRDFLAKLGLSAAGLVLAVYMPGLAAQETLRLTGEAPTLTGNGLMPNVFIHVATSGIVTIICHRAEMGQGVRSSLPFFYADELGASMDMVQVLQAEGDKKYGDQNTDGSSSVRKIFDSMRRSAATVRAMLIQAAANRWQVSPEKLTAEDNYVLLKGTQKKLSFGELAEEAGKLKVPSAEEVQLRPRKELKHLGKDLPLLDGPDYVTGRAIFGADVKLPGMLIAVIARPPVAGGKVKKHQARQALAIKGVEKVIPMPEPVVPYKFQPWGGIAVLARNTWTAIQGREALEIEWDHGENATYNSTDFRQALFASAKKGGTAIRKTGDVTKALKAASKVLEAEYYVPHIPHMTMEPPVAIAHYKKDDGGSCEVWAATQNPQAARTEVARVLGLSEDKVRVNVTLLGGGFGRKSKADFCSEAAWLSREAGSPVRVQFTREDDLHNDYLNTVNAQVLTAGLDQRGRVSAWKVNSAFPPIAYLFDGKSVGPSFGEFRQGISDLAISVPNIEAQGCEAKTHLRIGWLRSVYNIFHGFATNSFMDEIAHAKKVDTLDLMLELFSDGPMSLQQLGVEKYDNYAQPLEDYPVDGARMKGVLRQVAKSSSWKRRKKRKTHGYGIAAHRSFLSYVAVVAAVVKDKLGRIKVDEVWITIDAGTILNRDRVRAQMEGSVMNGITYFFNGGVTHKGGAVEQSSFDDAPLATMAQAPRKIHVDIIGTEAKPGGVGEPGVPPVAPAIANAIFALTGKRYREFGVKDLTSGTGA